MSSPLTLWVRLPLRWDVLDTTLCDKVCHCLTVGRWFFSDTLVSSTNKTDRLDKTEILLKVVLNTINTLNTSSCLKMHWNFASSTKIFVFFKRFFWSRIVTSIRNSRNLTQRNSCWLVCCNTVFLRNQFKGLRLSGNRANPTKYLALFLSWASC